MNISLSSDLSLFVDGLVATGIYATPEAAVQDAVLQMREKAEQLARLRVELQRGIDQADQGDLREINAAESKAAARRNLASLPR